MSDKKAKDDTPVAITEDMTEDLSVWESIKLGLKIGRKQAELNAQNRAINQETMEVQPPPTMSYTTYNWILFKCFDVCIKDFDNKLIDKTESDCATECAKHLKDSVNIYEDG